MKFFPLTLSATFLLSFYSTAATSYELTTHGALTRAAYDASILNDGTFRATLGLSEGKNPIGDTYFDVSGTAIQKRDSFPFEGKIIKDDLGGDPLSLVGWLMRGAIREDDSSTEDNPHDDASYNPDLKRPLQHFFDPYYNRSLTVSGLCPLVDCNIHKAPDWATGTNNTFADPNTRGSETRNHFPVFDAREAMYRTLTGTSNEAHNT